MIRHESKAGMVFRHWVLANAHRLVSGTFEIKQTQTDSIPFSCLEEGQVNHAEAIRYGKKGALIRVQSGTVGAPDYIFLKNSAANIVIFFAKKGFVIIAVDAFIMEKNRSKRKSLLWKRALELSHISEIK